MAIMLVAMQNDNDNTAIKLRKIRNYVRCLLLYVNTVSKYDSNKSCTCRRMAGPFEYVNETCDSIKYWNLINLFSLMVGISWLQLCFATTNIMNDNHPLSIKPIISFSFWGFSGSIKTKIKFAERQISGSGGSEYEDNRPCHG
jgi:hypothetical protein